MQKIQLLFNVGILLVLATLTAGEDTGVGDVGLYTASVKRGGNIQLPCDLKSNKALDELSWKFKDKPSSPGKIIAELTFKAGATYRFLSYQEQYNLNNDSYNLMVSNMNSSMEGYYTCYANNIVTNDYHLYMTDSCTVNNCKKSVKKGKLFLELSTPSDNLPKYFGSVKVTGECNGTTKEICDIALPNSSNTNCEFLDGLSSRYLIIVTNGEKYQLCDVYLILIKSSACFTSKVWNFTVKAEDEGKISTEELPSSSKGPISTNIPEPISTNIPEPISTNVPEPSTSAQDDTTTISKPRSVAILNGSSLLIFLMLLWAWFSNL